MAEVNCSVMQKLIRDLSSWYGIYFNTLIFNSVMQAEGFVYSLLNIGMVYIWYEVLLLPATLVTNFVKLLLILKILI